MKSVGELMGLFRAINRKFEGDLIVDIQQQLLVTYGMPSTLYSEPCHEGRGGFHSCIGVELAPGHHLYFHYCGGMGFSRYSGAGGVEWHEAPWMMAMKNEASRRIAGFVGVMQVTFQEATQDAYTFDSLDTADNDPISDFLADERDSDEEDLSGTYEELVQRMNETGLAAFEPFVAAEVGGGTPAEVICLQMFGDEPDFLLLAKSNTRLGWDGRWKTWWLTSTASGETSVEELDWAITIQKALDDNRKLEKLFDLLAEFLSEINNISKREVLGEAYFDDEDGDFASWIPYGDSQGIYGQIVDAIRTKDFGGVDIDVASSVEGVCTGPAVIFTLTHPYSRLVVVHKPNAMNWAATSIIETDGNFMQKVIPWKIRHTQNADSLADEVALLSYRLSFGDLSDH